jgi:hypothetical protein
MVYSSPASVFIGETFTETNSKIIATLLFLSRVAKKVRTNVFVGDTSLFSGVSCPLFLLVNGTQNRYKYCIPACYTPDKCVISAINVSRVPYIGDEDFFFVSPYEFVSFAKRYVKLYKDILSNKELARIKGIVYDKKHDSLIDEEARRINSLLIKT